MNSYKLFMRKAVGEGDVNKDKLNLIKPEFESICTQTFQTVGPFKNEEERNSCYSYMNTKFSISYLVNLNLLNKYHRMFFH
ncbi:hypothetical protein MALL_0581 [Mycoplasmopsis alligatoris A21JP2]|uniref:Uncharacterized protein n=1 Tax=Mycoplasmopsis alligatoris A21JP2 TaxID=747682 RepID=D4XVJ8_9BACT|nr:hypothetical protein MALL_0581 [Mycoplasmopsis alligatoris A21JP2]